MGGVSVDPVSCPQVLPPPPFPAHRRPRGVWSTGLLAPASEEVLDNICWKTPFSLRVLGLTEVDVQESRAWKGRKAGCKGILSRPRKYILREYLRLENRTYRSLRFGRRGGKKKRGWLRGWGRLKRKEKIITSQRHRNQVKGRLYWHCQMLPWGWEMETWKQVTGGHRGPAVKSDLRTDVLTLSVKWG